MRRRRSLASVSLFPFLSVLLCTLGALIFLLLVLDYQARQARAGDAEQARAERRRQEEARAAEIARRLADDAELADTLHRRALADAEGLRTRLAELEKLWETKRRTLIHIKHALDWDRQQLEELTSRLQSRRTELDRLTSQRAFAKALEMQLVQELEILNEQLRRLERVAEQNRRPRYSLVPYKGRRGTVRPPIFVECVKNAVKFQPSGETVRLDDFDSGRFRMRLEHEAEKLTSSDRLRRPFVLLLVRPSGIPLFYAALRALRDADIDLGYELIEEDWELDFTPAGSENPADAFGGIPPHPHKADDRKQSPGTGAPTALLPGADSGEARVWPPASLIAALGHSPGRPHLTPPGVPPADVVRLPDKTAPGGNGQPPGAGATPSDAGGNAGAVRPVPIGGASREWEIVIECRGNGVEVATLRQSFGLDAVARKDSPLAALIRSNIEARRRGIPDLQPRLKFIIHPDGLKSYYHAAEAVEGLKLPARWVVLDRENRPGEPPQK